MSEVLLTHSGIRNNDQKPCFWVLTKTHLAFYKDEATFKLKLRGISNIKLSSIKENKCQPASNNRYMLILKDDKTTTILLDKFGIINYWSLSINLVMQGAAKTVDELKFLMQGVSINEQAPQLIPKQSMQQPVQQTQQSQQVQQKPTQTRSPQPNQQKQKQTVEKQRTKQQEAMKKVELKESVLLSCELQTFNQRIMRHASCLEFVKNILRKEITIDDLKSDKYYVELFEKISGNQLNLDTSSDDITDKIHNLGMIKNQTQFIGEIIVPVEPMDIIRGNENSIITFIVCMFETFFLKQINVNGSRGLDGLMLWCEKQLQGSGIELEDFSETFKDGVAFAYIISKRRDDLLDPKYLSNVPSVNYSFVRKALEKCRCKIIPEEVYMDGADETSVLMILTCMMVCLG